ncbi:MAG: hypothetical protein M3444_03275 [Acidobacteriota bacterium]|nr:hypothetical protein [Acidobacteriota bacterium]MDQ5836419.1 hypothetical protein [Acidobacteriota bacterium]
MARQSETHAYALCVNNDGYEAALELRKLYKVVPPEKNNPADWLRIVDESGEDYLYSGERFVLLTLPRDVEEIVEETFSS